jgi:hypothetical protein
VFGVFIIGGLIWWLILSAVAFDPLQNRIAKGRRKNGNFQPILRKHLLFNADLDSKLEGNKLTLKTKKDKLEFKIPQQYVEKVDAFLDSRLNSPSVT